MPFVDPRTLDLRKSPQKVRKALGGGEWLRSRRSPGSARTAREGTPGRFATATPTAVERSRTFRTEADARRFASKIEVSVNEGTYIDPSLGLTLFKDWADEWLEGTAPALKPHTVAGYRTLLRKHVLPALGTMQLAKVRAIDVRRFVAELANSRLSPSRVRSTYFLVQAIFRAAVESGYIGRSPCVGVKLPRILVREMHFLTVDEVRAISSAVPDQYEALIDVLAFGTLRWGEAAALRRKHVDVLRRRLEVAESLADVDGHLHFGPTKTHQSRVVTLPKKTNEKLRLHLERCVASDRDALVFTSPEGDPLRSPNFRRRVWAPALREAGITRPVRIHDLRHTGASLMIMQGAHPIHDLRHTGASLMIMQGAHPKEIQQQLGHSSISLTLARYGHTCSPTVRTKSPTRWTRSSNGLRGGLPVPGSITSLGVSLCVLDAGARGAVGEQ